MSCERPAGPVQQNVDGLIPSPSKAALDAWGAQLERELPIDLHTELRRQVGDHAPSPTPAGTSPP